jgi:predicted RNase H-like HicB family nuclease
MADHVTKTTANDTTTYHARFELDPSGQWLVELEELPQVHTFGRTLGKAREYLLDALALWLDEPVQRVVTRVEFRPPPLPTDVEQAVWMARAEREIAEAASRVATDLNTKASVALVDAAHLSLRDAADILGLSHQRVQQLVAAGRPAKPTAPDPIGDAIENLARSVREYLPGGSKEDLGAVAAALALALGVALMQSR